MKIDDLKPGELWACPLCHQPRAMITEGKSKGNLRPHKDDGLWCDGAGFSPFRASFPQEVRLFGLGGAIARLRHEHGKPDWMPEPKQPGDLQKFVFDAWPQADRFETHSPVADHDRRGITFSVGPKRWHFAAYDSFLSKEFRDRADASDALYEYLKKGADRGR